MSLYEEIRDHSNGAHFLRADLHIHSYGKAGSYDVTDTGMTPQAIVDVAIAENLQVIAITDHNVVANVRPAVDHATGKNLLVVSGVELSTSDGHILLYFPTVDHLEGFYGKLKISPDKRACLDSVTQCLNYALEFDGFGVCAHVDAGSGLEQAHPKFDTFKQDILNCENLLGLEITQITNSEWFSGLDTHVDRGNCAHIRRTHDSLPILLQYPLSDVVALEHALELAETCSINPAHKVKAAMWLSHWLAIPTAGTRFHSGRPTN